MSEEKDLKVEAQEEESVIEETKETEETEIQEETELSLLQKQYDELYDQHLRTLAEYENYKRRTQKERQEIYQNAQMEAFSELLPVLDNLERAALTEEESPLSEGIRMIVKQWLETFLKLSVVPIEAVGKEFDPNLHNAVMHIEDENFGQNMVAEEFMKGYQMKEKVIRHSMVKVAN